MDTFFDRLPSWMQLPALLVALDVCVCIFGIFKTDFQGNRFDYEARKKFNREGYIMQERGAYRTHEGYFLINPADAWSFDKVKTAYTISRGDSVFNVVARRQEDPNTGEDKMVIVSKTLVGTKNAQPTF